MKSSWIVRPSAAEFPHENELIDRGALWIGAALGGAETPVAASKASKRRTLARVQALAPPMRTEPVDSLTSRAPTPSAETESTTCEERHPSKLVGKEPIATPAPPIVAAAEPVATPAPIVAAAEPVATPAPIVAVAEPVATPAPPVESAPEGAGDDGRVETFVRAIAEVARAHGPEETAAHVESLFKFGTPAPLELSPSARAALFDGNILEAADGGVHATAWFTQTSSAWQSILRGDGANLAACGESTLDGWTADLIACLVAKPSMASAIRRDLRRRGIAAFGMLDS